MKPGAVIQARMSSRRLPGKALADLLGKPMLERVVERARQAKRLDFVGVATSDLSEDDAIAEFCEAQGIPCYRGPLDDVLARTVEAARSWGLDPVVRITGDCPFVCPRLIDELVDRLLLENADYATLSGDTIHEGIDPFSRKALEEWNVQALSNEEREHLALLPERYPRGLRLIGRPARPYERARPPLRLSVDEPRQLAFARSTYAALGGNSDFTTHELIDVLDGQTGLGTGADAIAQRLIDAGIGRLHLYPGGTIAPTLNAWIEHAGEFVVARHEQGAGYAALAESRLSGKPAVVMVTSGPGVTNLMTVLADAWYDSTPLVAITGQVGTADLLSRPGVRQRGFQEVPTSEICGPITKACLRPMSPDDAADSIQEALRLSAEGRPGPVVVELPMDVQRGELSAAPEVTTASPATRKRTRLRTSAKNQLEELADWLASAERPLLLVGQGVLQAQASKVLTDLAVREQIPVVTSLLGLGAFPTDHELSFGYLGHTGMPWANRAVHECDLLVVVGSRLDLRQTGSDTRAFAAQARIARIDLDADELAESRVETELTIRCDAKQALQALAKTLRGQPSGTPTRDAWHMELKKWRQQLPIDHYPAGEGCHPAQLLRALDAATSKGERVVVTGVGHHQQWAARHLQFASPRKVLLTSGGHGAMGYDLPTAVGACLARPKAQVLCVVGDGSFQINSQELATLAEHQLPAKIVVLDNQRLAMVSQFQNLTWGHDPSTGDRPGIDFAALARAHQIPSFKLDKMDAETSATLETFVSVPGPALLWARIDPACEVSPMLLAGQSLDAMWYWGEDRD